MPPRKVLIVDDDRDMVEAVRSGLESFGLAVGVASDGMQGLIKAHQMRPDVIFLDFNMPAGGGASLYERLRNSNDTCRIPVVFTTVVKAEEVMGRIQPGPQTYWVKKPVSLRQLKAMVEKVLDGDDGTASELIPLSKTEQLPSASKRSEEEEGCKHEFQVRVTYADTDKMGVIYYANYLKYFEIGRIELLRSLGLRYRDLEANRKLFLPVMEARCEYLGPSRYDDLLIVRTWLSRMGPASVNVRYEIYDRDAVDRLVCRGMTRHAVVNERWQPTKIPADLRVLLQPYVVGE